MMTNDQVISVTVQNNSGQTLYIGLNRADGPWLDLTASPTTWVSDFDQSTCVQEIASGQPYSFDFPEYDSGKGCRMYVSEQDLTGAPNLATATYIYDKVEMGWNAIWNLTNVDFLGFPMQLIANGQIVGYREGVARENLFDVLNNMPVPYNSFKFTNEQGNVVYRFFSPQQMTSADLQGCLDNAISTGLPELVAYFQNNPGFSFNYGGYVMSEFAQPSSGELTLRVVQQTQGVNEMVTLTEITTKNVVSGEIVYQPNVDPDDPGTQAAAKAAGLISTCLNRGVIANPAQWGDSGQNNCGTPWFYYKNLPSNANEYNHYSLTLHNYSIDGKCYALSYDDFFHQDSSIQVNGGGEVTINILPFAKSPNFPPPNTYNPENKYSVSFGVPADYPFSDWGYIKVGKQILENPYDMILCNQPKQIEVGFTGLSSSQIITLDLENSTIVSPPANCIPGIVFTDNVMYFPTDPVWEC